VITRVFEGVSAMDERAAPRGVSLSVLGGAAAAAHDPFEQVEV
jgi:hypothetical protein